MDMLLTLIWTYKDDISPLMDKGVERNAFIPDFILCEDELSLEARFVYAGLYQYQLFNSGKLPFSSEVIGEGMGVSAEKLEDAVEELHEKGFLKIKDPGIRVDLPREITER